MLSLPCEFCIDVRSSCQGLVSFAGCLNSQLKRLNVFKLVIRCYLKVVQSLSCIIVLPGGPLRDGGTWLALDSPHT